MMAAPPVSSLLDAWERAAPLPAATRPFALLSMVGDDSILATQPVGEHDRRLLLLRAQVFGTQLTALTECPACAAQVELDADVNDLFVDRPAELPATQVLISGDTEVHFRLPTAADVGAIAELEDAAHARQVLLARCIVSVVRDEAVLPTTELSDDLVDAVTARMDEADPQGRIELAVSCPACSHAWHAPFDIGAFFWMELSAWAHGLLADVHALARAYGWRESDVLTLSAARRRFYLDLVES